MVEEKKKAENSVSANQNGPYDKSYTAESAKGYVPVDTTTTNNSMHYADKNGMNDADKADLHQTGVDYNTAKAANTLFAGPKINIMLLPLTVLLMVI